VPAVAVPTHIVGGLPQGVQVLAGFYREDLCLEAAAAIEGAVLRTPADPVRPFDGDLAALVRDLEETVDHPGRAGLAAPQIGVGLRVFAYNVDGVLGHVVNPVVVSLSEEPQDDDEGCLSVPGLYAPTVRAMRAAHTQAAGAHRSASYC